MENEESEKQKAVDDLQNAIDTFEDMVHNVKVAEEELAEALKRYEEVKPDVVTLDIVMPGMDGLETCEKMRHSWPDSNIFMVSSMAYEDMINRAAAMGAKTFLFKPFTREDLLQGLRGALEPVTKG